MKQTTSVHLPTESSPRFKVRHFYHNKASLWPKQEADDGRLRGPIRSRECSGGRGLRWGKFHSCGLYFGRLFSSEGYFAHLPRIQGCIILSQTSSTFSDSRFEVLYLKKLTVLLSPQNMSAKIIFNFASSLETLDWLAKTINIFTHQLLLYYYYYISVSKVSQGNVWILKTKQKWFRASIIFYHI